MLSDPDRTVMGVKWNAPGTYCTTRIRAVEIGQEFYELDVQYEFCDRR